MSMVVDAQVHVWLPESATRVWPVGGQEWRRAGHRGERVDGAVLRREMADAGVDRAVLVPPLFEGHRNDYALGLARGRPDSYRVMVRLDLRGEAPASELAHVVADPLVAGVRLVFLPIDAGRLADHRDSAVWAEAQRLDVPIMVHAPDQLTDVAAVAGRFPGLRLAIDHLGLSGRHTDGAVGDEIGALVELARFPNVAVKLSALPCYSTEPYPHPALQRAVRGVLDGFGDRRVFWGSDLSRLPGAYRDAVALTRDHLCRSGQEADAVLGGSLLRWLDWQ